MARPPMIFEEITAALFAELLAKAKAAGVQFSPDGTTAAFMHCNFAIAYNAATGQLSVSILSKPVLVPVSTIVSHFTNLVNSAKGEKPNDK